MRKKRKNRNTPMVPLERIHHSDRSASENGDHLPNQRKSQSNAETGQHGIESPDNREKILENRESKEAVGYGCPPVAFRFRPGQSGNPGGRPKKDPVSRRYAEMLETRLPQIQRRQLEQEIGMKLTKNFSIGDAIALKTCIGAMNSPKTAREVREATEGTAAQRIFVPEPPVQRDPDELRRHIFGKLVETSYKRHKLYNMEMPELEKMAAEAGVNLEEAMGDAEPSPEAPSGDKKP